MRLAYTLLPLSSLSLLVCNFLVLSVHCLRHQFLLPFGLLSPASTDLFVGRVQMRCSLKNVLHGYDTVLSSIIIMQALGIPVLKSKKWIYYFHTSPLPLLLARKTSIKKDTQQPARLNILTCYVLSPCTRIKLTLPRENSPSSNMRNSLDRTNLPGSPVLIKRAKCFA